MAATGAVKGMRVSHEAKAPAGARSTSGVSARASSRGELEVVRAPVRDHAPAVRGQLDPARARRDLLEVLRVSARPVVRHRRIRRAEPGGVVERLRHRLRRRTAAGLVEADADLDARDAPEASVADELDDLAELRTRTLPGTDLDDETELRCEISHDTTFLNRLRERLLQIQMLARQKTLRRDQGVLMYQK